MMLLTFCDVIGRKFVGSSITGVVEVSELLMLTLIFTGLPLCSMRSEHVIFDLLDKFLPRFLARFQNFLAHSICFVLLAGSTWLVFERAARTMEQGDITAQLLIPMGPFYYGTALMLAITALVHSYLAFQPVQDDDEIKAGAL
jgi:TRAP-type transport system small permease protein